MKFLKYPFLMVASLFQQSKRFVSAQQTSILSAAVIIMSLSVVSALLGLLRYRLLDSFFGTPTLRLQADAFLVAFQIPDLLFQLLVAGVLSATFIPVYSRVLHKSEEESHVFVSALMILLAVCYVLIAIIAGIFAPEIIRSMTGAKYTLAQVDLSVQLMRIMLVSTFFLLLSNFFSGILQSSKRFILPSLSPVVYNLGNIIGIVFLSRWFGIYGAAIGVVIGAFVHFVIQLPDAFKLGFRFRFSWPILRPDVLEVIRLMVPRGATLATNNFEDFVGLFVVTSLGSTFVLLYSAAQSLAAAPIRFFGVSIAQAALPFFTSKAKDGDMKGLTSLLTETLHQIAFFMYPAGALLLVLRVPIVRLAMGAKQLPWSDTVTMGQLVAIYALSIAALAMTNVVLRAYFAIKETRLPFLFACISMTINVVVMWLAAFVFKWGIISVAIGPTTAAICEFLLQLIFFFRKVHSFSSHEFFIPQGKMVLATAIMGVALYIPMKLLDQLVFDTTRVVGLIALTLVVSLVGMVVYLVLCWLLHIEQLSIVTSLPGKIKGWQAKLSKTTEVLAVEEETTL
ncbi:murein biosynthesis integral membrane protein MurJ [Candidatus Cerribacteria bacterium 'Amazon FNV 2010 28 9']|uniref:Murein biosynthesis integral membrane protein MurJ n=1 Tax=Candidatus Cerribacteria bacterium 'Amazon FNV 2010 28 9' TaxID=2081795 RepID=A0A317JPM0_9BACT|nr:MAG: murein biosynthesis integral membrane protein MurJ [Candidatus Cerribacteria bacterium 'Amazon FNV 2010 28 9']